MTEKNEKKKKYLKEYRGHVRRINRIEEELAELREMKMSISVNNDGMPHGSGQSDMSGYAAKLDQLERNLNGEKNQRLADYTEILDRIMELSSENERDVLFYRYIKGFTWWDIAEKMDYSERWVLQIHGKALAHLKLPKEFIEIQSNL